MTTPAHGSVYEELAYDQLHTDHLANQIAATRLAAYEQRLNQLAQSMNIPGRQRLTDAAILNNMIQDSTDTAAQVVRTHNADLARFLAAQPPNTPASQLRTSAQQWESERATWKATQIAQNEGMTARNQADRDVLERNGLNDVLVRVAPQSAAEPFCQALIAEGWIKYSDVFYTLPFHVNCVAEDTIVQAIGDIDLAFRSLYSGPMITVVTKNKMSVTVTPNHMMMTDRGWIAAQFLNESDYVVSSRETDGVFPNVYYSPSKFSDLFDSLWTNRSRMQAVASSNDFHGDGRFMTSEVDIVLANGFLTNKRNANLNEQGFESPLMIASGRSLSFTSDSAFPELNSSIMLSSSRGMSSFNMRRMVSGGAHDNASSPEVVSERFWRNVNRASDVVVRFSDSVTLDEVVEVRNDPAFVGHVYDLSTRSSVYAANGILTHNCPHGFEYKEPLRASADAKRTAGETIWIGS